MRAAPAGDPRRVPPRLALASIAGFWTLYFAILTLRALAIYHDHANMPNRAVVSALSAGITCGVWLLLQRFRSASLGPNVMLAAVLSLPAATVYSAVNWYFFSYAGGWQVFPWAGPHCWHADAQGHAQAMTVGMMCEPDMSPLATIADQAANGYFFFVCWAALYLALGYAQEVGRLERHSAGLRAAAQAAELRALRYQVNPHFLFNTLNSLSSLVLSGRRDEAERMILNLSTFFRSSLTGDPTHDVPLRDEFQLQQLYLDIEAVRFPARLRATIDLPDALADACVPGLILQPVVENAIKHGVARTRAPVTVAIRARREGERLVLSVEDDGAAADGSAAPGTGVGLENVRARLAARFGAAAGASWGPIVPRGFAVRLTLPLVRDGC